MPEIAPERIGRSRTTPTTGTATVGVDVGGTKTHVVALGPDGGRADLVVPSSEWRHGSLFASTENFARLAALVARVVPAGAGTTRVAYGMHGIDTAAQQAIATAELVRHTPGPVLVVNDALLLGPAAGYTECLTLVVGTGAALLGTTRDGTPLSADGYGAVLSDHGSAPALVRELVRSALRSADWGTPAATLDDPAVRALCDAYAVTTLQDLALAVSLQPAMTWGVHAPLVFDAAARGSALAGGVLRDAADVLARNVAALRRRGAVGDVVVAAGGVITQQPVLRELLAARLTEEAADLRLEVLRTPPVEGAVALAADL
ncbi:N-acetylglucosamine kinase [Cellulomonas soli]|uniref:N-acetylglucosamine kinase n=1 Tax=Cellulomonas soli TaxID=931535 RepID=UPI003F87807A